MQQYEEFLMDAFPKVRAVCDFPSGITKESDLCRKRAIRFVEMNCIAVYGFPDEIHYTEDEHKSVGMIPGTYYSAFLLPFLREEKHLHPSVPSIISKILLASRGKAGFWRFFMNVDDRTAALLPDDIDSSSLAMMGLLKTGHIKMDDCRSTLQKMLENSVDGPNGEIGTWLLLDMSETERLVLYKTAFKNPRVDAGSMINALWCLAHFDMDSLPRLAPSLKFLDNFIDQLMESDHSDELIQGMIYYTNRDFIYFLISRYLSVSQNARNIFGKKSALLIKRRLLDFKFSSDKKALNAALIIFAVMLLKIHRDDGQPWITDLDEVAQIRAKVKNIYEAFPSFQSPDGSFPAGQVYNWYRIGEYAGTKAFSTAMVLSTLSKVEQEFF